MLIASSSGRFGAPGSESALLLYRALPSLENGKLRRYAVLEAQVGQLDGVLLSSHCLFVI